MSNEKTKSIWKTIYKPVFIFLVLLRATLFWICWPIFRSGMPWSVAMLYRERGSDIQYFPYMSGLAFSGIRDAFDVKAKGTGIISFPIASMTLHSSLFRLFNVVGFIIADCITALVVYFLFSKVLQKMKVKKFWADSFSLILVTGGFHKFFGISKIICTHLGNHIIPVETILFALLIYTAMLTYKAFKKNDSKKVFVFISFIISLCTLTLFLMYPEWEYFGWRFPRPFISEVFFLGFILVLFKIFSSDKPANWIVLGLFASLVVQSDIFRATFCLLFFALCWVYLYWKDRKRRVSLIKGGVYYAASLLFFSLLFIAQRISENPDVPRRFGTYPLSRLSFFFNDYSLQDFYFFSAICSAFLIVFSFYKGSRKNVSPEEAENAKFITAFYILSWLCLPLFIFITGKGIVLGHFLNLFHYMATFLLIVGFAHLFQIGEKVFQIEKIRTLTLVLIIIFSLFSTARDTQTTFQLKSHIRADFKEYEPLPNYINNFTALVQELQKDPYKPNLALVTFDTQVLDWWCTFKQGLVFLPDVFHSTQPDNILESRLNRIGSLLGFSDSEFFDFISEKAINLFFLSIVKYQLSKAYAFSTLNDYDPAALESLKKTSIYSTFNLAIPISEKTRLIKKYHDEKGTGGITPDLIILQDNPFLSLKTPDQKLYRLTFSNEVFRVWIKR